MGACLGMGIHYDKISLSDGTKQHLLNDDFILEETASAINQLLHCNNHILQKGVLTSVELANCWSHCAVRPFRGMPPVVSKHRAVSIQK